MLKFREFLLLESFDIRSKPLRMSVPNMRSYAIEYLKTKYNNGAEKVYDSMSSHYVKIMTFKVEKSEKYIIFIMETTDSIEIHFNNFNDIDNSSKLNKERLPLDLFSDIFNIIYWYGLSESKKTIISHEDPSRLKFYNKIIQKVLDKHKPGFEAITKSNNIIIFKPFKNNTTFTERFMSESADNYKNGYYNINILEYLDVIDRYDVTIKLDENVLNLNYTNGIINNLTTGELSTYTKNIFKNIVINMCYNKTVLMMKYSRL